MAGGRWKRLLTNNTRFPAEHPEYRCIYLLNLVLIALSAVYLFYTVMNTVYQSYIGAAINGVSVLAAAALLYYFHRTDRVESTTMMTVFVMLGTLFVFLAIAGNDSYAFCWISVFPPVAYFLLGRRKAHMVSAVYGLLLLGLLFIKFRNWEPVMLTTESLLNIAGSSICVVILVSYFELSRKEAVSALEQKNKELERLSVTDPLTGLYNRTRLDSAIALEMNRAIRSFRTFSVIMADLDHFKNINDKYGHMAGDTVLREIGKVLRDNCRATDVVGRFGGEEFLVICPETDGEGAEILAQKLLNSVSEYGHASGLSVTMSLGVTTFRQEDTVDKLIGRADRALYRAKENGRNRAEIA